MEHLTYLSFIQNVIGRLSILGVITKLGAIVAVAICLIGSPITCLLGCLLVLAAWFLDGFFLKLEKAYRRLYDVARLNPSDFLTTTLPSGKADDAYLTLNPFIQRGFAIRLSVLECMLSKTFIPYYGTLVVVLFVGMILV